MHSITFIKFLLLQ